LDFVAFLGGLALGATGAALYDASFQSKSLGQPWDDDDNEDDPAGGGGSGSPGGAFASAGGGGGGGGGGHAGGPGGVFVGPPAGGGGTSGPMAPPIGLPGPSQPAVPSQPTVSVPPILTPGVAFDESFFGVSAPPWFWPLNYWPSYPPANQELVCRKQTSDEGDETFVCRPRYPVQNVAFAYGPPGYWMSGRR